MLHLLELFRLHAAGRPLLLSIGFLLLLVVGRSRASLRARFPDWSIHATHVAGGAGALGLIAYLAIALWYASNPQFFDNAEPTMPAVGWLSSVGQPLYPSVAAPQRYAHIYGPFAYMFHGAVLATFGPSIAAAKWASAFAGVASLWLIYAVVRRHCPVPRSATLTGCAALTLLLFRNCSFWTRPDPLQLLAVCAALLFATSVRGNISAMLVGIASGVLWNLKFTGPLYSVPIFALVHRRCGVRATAVAFLVGVAVAAMPFAFFSNVSLANYLAWVHLSARTGLQLSLLTQNVEWALYLSLPLAVSFFAVPRRPVDAGWRDVTIALVIGMSGVVIAAAKPGAGPYHLIPFVPTVVYLVAQRLSATPLSGAADAVAPRAVVAILLAACAMSTAQQAQLITTVSARSALRELEDIKAFADAHPGTIEMGYGQSEALSLERPFLVFRSGVYLLDQPAIREHQLEGVEFPQATVDAVTNCQTKYWLIPKGEPPFSGVNGYNAVFLRPLYPPEFRRAFEAAYKRVGTTAYYDVWQCSTGGGT